MNQEKIVQLKQGLTTAFINQNTSSNLAYKPQFVSNNYREGRKVISSIEDELLSCEEFAISVAFITMGGITPLLQTLRELEQRGISGKILTTDYLMFSDPKALRILANFKNIQLKMFITENSKEGFHTKGYIFKKEEMYRIIVGSSNMTLSALTTIVSGIPKLFRQNRENIRKTLLLNLKIYGMRSNHYHSNNL